MIKFLKDFFGMTPPSQAIKPIEPVAPVQPINSQPPKKETVKKPAAKPAKITGAKKETAKKAPAKTKKK
jgi:hypothetical protein